MPLDDVLPVLEHFQMALRRMIEARAGREPKPGRLPDKVRVPGTLWLVATSTGSFTAELALAEPNPDEFNFSLAEEAVDELLAGMRQPEELPSAVAREVGAIQTSMSEGVDLVRFGGNAANAPVTLRRKRSVTVAEQPPSVRTPSQAHGRILEVDWKDGTAELHTAGRVVSLEFAEDRAEDLRRFATQSVTVEGMADVTDHGDPKTIEVETIAIGIDDGVFWRSRSFDELAEEQRVGPFVFPASEDGEQGEENVDEFLEAIFGDKKGR